VILFKSTDSNLTFTVLVLSWVNCVLHIVFLFKMAIRKVHLWVVLLKY